LAITAPAALSAIGLGQLLRLLDRLALTVAPVPRGEQAARSRLP